MLYTIGSQTGLRQTTAPLRLLYPGSVHVDMTQGFFMYSIFPPQQKETLYDPNQNISEMRISNNRDGIKTNILMMIVNNVFIVIIIVHHLHH